MPSAASSPTNSTPSGSIRRERLEALLTARRLCAMCAFIALLAPDSPRNQDLGMVAHRLFLTCEAPRRTRREPRRSALISDVAVVLGDPRLPDPVKRNGHFNEEDIETIDRLKAALARTARLSFPFSRQPRGALCRPAEPTGRTSCSICATRASTMTRSWNCTCRHCWRCSTSPIAAPVRPAWALLQQVAGARHRPVDRRAGAGRDLFQLRTIWRRPFRRCSRP